MRVKKKKSVLEILHFLFRLLKKATGTESEVSIAYIF